MAPCTLADPLGQLIEAAPGVSGPLLDLTDNGDNRGPVDVFSRTAVVRRRPEPAVEIGPVHCLGGRNYPRLRYDRDLGPRRPRREHGIDLRHLGQALALLALRSDRAPQDAR